MKGKREEAAVGLFVCIAAALLIGTVLAVSGTFSSGGVSLPHLFQVCWWTIARGDGPIRRNECRQGQDRPGRPG